MPPNATNSEPEFPAADIEGNRVQFFAKPLSAELKPSFALMIALYDSKILISNIAERGWCIPSGKIEQGETPENAAIRESLEEGFVSINPPLYLGYYELHSPNDLKFAPLFFAEVQEVFEPKFNSEVLDRRFVSFQELPAIYYTWNPLIDQVFEFALAQARDSQA